jgi:hypothetical protein
MRPFTTGGMAPCSPNPRRGALPRLRISRQARACSMSAPARAARPSRSRGWASESSPSIPRGQCSTRSGRRPRDEFLRRQGLTPIAVTGFGPGALSTLAQFLDKIASGEISYVWSVPAEIQRRCLPSLRAWAERAYDLDELRAIPREITWTIYG